MKGESNGSPRIYSRGGVTGWYSMDFIRYVIFNGDLFYLVSLLPIIGAGSFLSECGFERKQEHRQSG
jgi:hypothetical protein